MPLPKEHTYTVEDIYNLSEGQRAELIDDQIYYMAPPSTQHQRMLSFLHLRIAQHILSKKGNCEIFPAPFAVFLNETDAKYVEPDLSVICDMNKLNDKGCKGAPDWIIEIVSPGSRRMDYAIKLFKYRSAGVREYWIVDLDKNRIMVHNFEHEDINEYTFSDMVKAGIYEDLSIDFSKLDI
ncbi:Uma2 family endonuclease [Novisyntrophococcus fermenticellae]|uniref:Uma2 family endonuclease n=1 Tax=Novisyntrophococcus fermenticellae TaxID=2068655 RepID=UPI001E2E4209|nr:Uma2 family endonuclease [Novisyntrophococcus fermenticellae]